MTPNPHNEPRHRPDNPTQESRDELPDGRSWHETGTLPNGMRIGKLGALWYLLDEDGYAVSRGYHSISDDGTRGELGPDTYSIEPRVEPARREVDG